MSSNEQEDPTKQQALTDADIHTHLHPFSALGNSVHAAARIISRASGVYVYGPDGRKYLDAGGGLWCMAIGYGRGEIAEVMAEQTRQLSYAHTFSSQTNECIIRLSEKTPGACASVDAPRLLRQQWFGS